MIEQTQSMQTQKENKMKLLQQVFLTILIAALFTTTTLTPRAFALDNDEPPAVETMTVDLLILKPLGFVATVAGYILFTAALPFTVWSDQRINEAGKRFVVDPGVYTFVRPLGHGIHDMP